MNKFYGKTAAPGLSIGEIVIIKKPHTQIENIPATDTDAEIKRLNKAIETAKNQISVLYKKTTALLGSEYAAIFEVQLMMLDDEFKDAILQIIKRDNANSEYAVTKVGANFSAIFAAMDDAYMKERAQDVRDLSDRLVRILLSTEKENRFLPPKSIIIADELTPSEIIKFDREKVVAFVSREGSVNSHSAILARAMNIPALIKISVPEAANGKTAIVNADEGFIHIGPDHSEITKAKTIIETKLNNKITSNPLINPPISISANITGLSDADEAIQNNADGIGLFRSEFLYLGKNAPPAEEEQFQIYKQIAKKMSGKKVIIRTADLGYDKLPDYILAEKEQNPALGCRGIRFSFKYIDLFKTQLRAIYRAALYGNIGIMLPMITSLNEVKKTKKLIAEIKAELTKEGQIWGNVDFGIMIETPAAVVLAADFAKQVDFFSIGTNDLESYTLAIDRLSADADVYTDPTYQAILKMIALTAAAARQAGIKVSICGDLAAYPALLEYFINLGIDELSVPPANIPHLRLR